MAPKKVKSSKVSNVTEAMKKKSKVENSDKGLPLVVLDPPTTDVGGVLESCEVMDVRAYFLKKYRLNYSLQNYQLSQEMSQHCLFHADEARYKPEIDARDVELEKLKEEIRAQVEKVKILEVRNQELEEGLHGLRDQKGSATEDLDKVCSSLKSNILLELKGRVDLVDLPSSSQLPQGPSTQDPSITFEVGEQANVELSLGERDE
ncbi:hypothetical protein JCGZ_10296 [Jatropha curcas]|uniref:Uncharacterized protein n=1 Tax=Jatropha curcas TaxID=180498 RepID=A0A067KVE8_JATCU|nr:hypothetical protein JCGZ_10296 [Jatropha curcas]